MVQDSKDSGGARKDWKRAISLADVRSVASGILRTRDSVPAAGYPGIARSGRLKSASATTKFNNYKVFLIKLLKIGSSLMLRTPLSGKVGWTEGGERAIRKK